MHVSDLNAEVFSVLLCVFLVAPCLGADTISINRSLTWNRTIVSATGIFELGFFRPGKSSNSYIGLWYKQVSEQTILWVANREKPVSVSDLYSCELKILNGNLVLTTSGSNKKPIWSTDLNSTSASETTEAVLLDSGNFVLRDGPNSSNLLWQSSDYPAHVWLPGYKMGIDKRTGMNRVLRSWKNSEDPAPGLYMDKLQLKGTVQFELYWNQTVKYWNSGEWDPRDQSFALIPGLKNRQKDSYHFNVVDNENETYFTFFVRSHAIPSRVVMDVSGQLKSSVWSDNMQKWILFLAHPDEQCEVYRFCGAFGSCNQQMFPYCSCLRGFQPKSAYEWSLNDYSSGCVRRMQLQCMNASNSSYNSDRFWASYSMVLPEHPQRVEARSVGDCELACLNNCSCTAYAYSSDGCSIWIGDLMNVKQLSDGDPNGGTLYIRLDPSEFRNKSDKRWLIGVTMGSVSAFLAFSGLVICAIIGRRKRLRVEPPSISGSLVQFQYKELQNATKNFTEKLGGGGFGCVFKGRLPDSSFVAVKMLEGSGQGEKQFRAEVSTIGKVQHVNIVRLCGFCSEGAKRLLVYEYMPNGSLNKHLFQGLNPIFLNWRTRYQIALGTAKGLTYLHEKCKDRIIHCDIKPENILLDADFSPKIADFGLAKLFGREFSRVLTTMRGTRGYLAPEWISGEAITAKADVYSYGMMLFEIISGRRNSEQFRDDEFDFFPGWALRKVSEGEDILSIVDHRLEGNADREEVTRLCKLACWCIQDAEDQRLTMGHVVRILEGVTDIKMPPIPRSFQIFASSYSEILFFAEGRMSEASHYASPASSSSHSLSSYVTANSQA